MIPTSPGTPRVARAVVADMPLIETCVHCSHLGTTATGALWRVSRLVGRDDLYFLHVGCLALYKAAHGLRSVEGRIPCAEVVL